MGTTTKRQPREKKNEIKIILSDREYLKAAKARLEAACKTQEEYYEICRQHREKAEERIEFNLNKKCKKFYDENKLNDVLPYEEYYIIYKRDNYPKKDMWGDRKRQINN